MCLIMQLLFWDYVYDIVRDDTHCQPYTVRKDQLHVVGGGVSVWARWRTWGKDGDRVGWGGI